MSDQLHRKSARVIPPRPPVKFDRSPMTGDEWQLLGAYVLVWAVVLYLLFQWL